MIYSCKLMIFPFTTLQAFTKMIETGVTVHPVQGGPAAIPEMDMSNALPDTSGTPRGGKKAKLWKNARG